MTVTVNSIRLAISLDQKLTIWKTIIGFRYYEDVEIALCFLCKTIKVDSKLIYMSYHQLIYTCIYIIYTYDGI